MITKLKSKAYICHGLPAGVVDTDETRLRAGLRRYDRQASFFRIKRKMVEHIVRRSNLF